MVNKTTVNKTIKTEAIAAPAVMDAVMDAVTPTPSAEQARENVLNAIATIRANLPFLVDLTTEERRALPKLGDASWKFVEKSLELALHNQDFLPRSFDVERMRQNVERWKQLSLHLLEVNQLQELMDDTYIALGSELFSNALQIYHYAKSVNHTGTLEQAVIELGKRFARKNTKRKPEEAIEPTSKADEV